jgi:hypothetical protein
MDGASSGLLGCFTPTGSRFLSYLVRSICPVLVAVFLSFSVLSQFSLVPVSHQYSTAEAVFRGVFSFFLHISIGDRQTDGPPDDVTPPN